jgi:hypothetical protein
MVENKVSLFSVNMDVIDETRRVQLSTYQQIQTPKNPNVS